MKVPNTRPRPGAHPLRRWHAATACSLLVYPTHVLSRLSHRCLMDRADVCSSLRSVRYKKYLRNVSSANHLFWDEGLERTDGFEQSHRRCPLECIQPGQVRTQFISACQTYTYHCVYMRYRIRHSPGIGPITRSGVNVT